MTEVEHSQSITASRGFERSIKASDGSVTSRSSSKTTDYDAADRPVLESTGARDGTSVRTTYTRRGAVGRVESSEVGNTFAPLVAGVKRDPDGLVTEIRYGDPTGTRTAFDYDDLRRLRNLTTYRAELNQETPPGQQPPPWHALLQDEQYIYDKVGNPVEIRDWRSENEWDPGFKPVSRKMVYDDLYRLTRIDYQYHPTGSDVWVDPYAAEFSDNTRPQPPVHEYRSNPKRVMKQSWSYDWLGNTTATTDDANLFYDRSLGAITNTGYRLTSASQPKIEKPSHTIEAAYDPAGYMRSMTVTRPETLCAVDKACPVQTYEYQWDEVGRLTRATRKDGAVQAAELTYAYDASDNRVRKSVKVGEDWRHTIYVFGSLELRSTDFSNGEYTVDPSTEVPYLFGHGVRLARVTYIGATAFTDERRRVFLEMGDHLGSTSVVMDRATGELVERSTAYAYGAAESNYRPGDWYEFREDYRFTGKEDDIEVGLIYFGARYLNPQLGRWISADPLAVHAPGKADLNLYAYVHGRVLSAVDPVGLQERPTSHAAPAAGAKPVPPPVPGTSEYAFQEGVRVGTNYGELKAKLEDSTAFLRGERGMAAGADFLARSPELRMKVAQQTARQLADALSALPSYENPDLQAAAERGFAQGAGQGMRSAKLSLAIQWLFVESIIGGLPGSNAAANTAHRAFAGMLRSALRQEARQVMLTLSKREAGPVMAAVLDIRTGSAHFALNGSSVPGNLHPILKARLDAMTAAGHPSLPGAHAEVRALNDALWARQAKVGSVTEADLGEFMLDTTWLRGSKAGGMVPLTPAPRCGNCTPLTQGVLNLAGDAPPRP